MAYAFTITKGPLVPFGDGLYRQTIRVAETDAAAASEWEIDSLPQSFDLVAAKVVLGAGTGTVIGPIELGAATGWAVDTIDDVTVSTVPAAAFLNDQTRYACAVGSGASLFGRSMVDAGTDNVITTELIIELGER